MLYWNASRRGPASPTHIITGFDEETRRGVCAICGPVKVYVSMDSYVDGRPRRRLSCSQRVIAGSARSRRRYQRSRGRHARRYGISTAQFDGLVLSQEGRCAICETELRKLNVDHDHETGRVRGLLCVTCNTGLGKFGDDPAVLRRAAEYIGANVIAIGRRI